MPINLHSSIDALARAAVKPRLFERTPTPFWDEPHISEQMLAAHLDPSHDAASRRPETIARSVSWVMSALALQPGMHLLDLGCGPGLYCRQFAQAGLAVTGIDYSQRSIDYAVADALAHDLPITYHYQNYLGMSYEAQFDVICLIWCDFGALTDDERAQLLSRVSTALRPGGVFVLDVFTLHHLAGLSEASYWGVHPGGGFWHPDSHLELQQRFLYPEADAEVMQYLILTANNEVTAYHLWNRCFSPDGISNLLAGAGLITESYWSDLTGKIWEDAAATMGVIARKQKP